MNTNHTTIVLLFTLSLAFLPAMGQKSPDRVSELPSLPAGEQQRVTTLKQLASTLSAHYQTHPLAGEAHYDHEHFNPLHWLAYVGDLPKDDLPQKVKDHLAAIDYAQDIPLLIQSGIDVNAATPREITPLMIAASEGQADVVKQLLTCPEIAVNAQTKQGATALILAAHKGHAAVVEHY